MSRQCLGILFGAAIVMISQGTAVPSRGGEIQFVERFALARDRAEALEQLVPGSEDYFYYYCLHHQQTEQFDQVEDLLKRWIKQHGNTGRVREIQHRQALLTYDQNPQRSLEYLRQELNLHFNHQRELLNQKPNLPTQLDEKLIIRETLTRAALRRHRNLDGFTDAALDWLTAAELNPIQRRHLLQRLKRPDYRDLAEMVVKDLNYKGSGGFGSLEIHRQLLPAQLDACLKSKPELLNHPEFVNTYLAKLQPGHDADWQNDHEELAAYLDRLWSFVNKLEPVHNSLKAHVLYHRLALDRSRGEYNKRRFMQYIEIPRSVGYLPREFRESQLTRRYAANLGQDFRSITLLAAVGNDEPLVRDFLGHFFVTEASYKAYQPYIAETYLQHLFAETKIVNGLGDAEQWYAMLPPEMYRALRDRVDLDFAADNRTFFGPNEPVAVDLFVKNVDNLIVKVYEINTRNYYQQLGREVNTDVNLDGLIANEETTYEYDEPPLRRIRRHFEFPGLNKPGTYVADFIGNGTSSRVVIRKGRLQYLVRTTAAGLVFNVLDEERTVMKDATLWLSGHEYQADSEGDIRVPFTNEPGRQAIILSSGGRSSLHYFDHRPEAYQLTAGIYVDRESLLSHRKATVLVRPGLSLNGVPVSLRKLKNVKLRITSTDHDGTQSTQEVDNFTVFEDRDSEYEFQVPPRLANIEFQLSAAVDVVSQAREQDLAVTERFLLNEIERSDKIEDLHFAHVGSGYFLELLGRTGEPKPHRPVHLRIRHRDYAFDVQTTLQTDAAGQITLGSLSDIKSITATTPSNTTHTWQLRHDAFTYYRSIHALAGEPVEVPYLGSADGPQRNELSLLELRGDRYAADHFDKIKLRDGLLTINDLPPGDYDLWLKRQDKRLRLRITEGARQGRYAFGSKRRLEIRNERPLHIKNIDVDEDHLTIQLQNADNFTRVHVFATRFEPAHDAFSQLAHVRDAEPLAQTVARLRSLYLAGRNIGDEYRYILDRRYAQKFPGSMLERPSLLLNPWDIRSTETGEQRAAAGEDFAPAEDAEAPPAERRLSEGRGEVEAGDFHNLDFLANPAVVLLNLVPDDDGKITIAKDRFESHQQLQIVAVDPITTVARHVALADTKNRFSDIRLIAGLDPTKHFTQQKHISVIPAGQQFRLQDMTTSRFTAYDSLAGVYDLFQTLTGDRNLAKFEFILRWPDLEEDEKQAKYNEFACHELSYFLAQKDPGFFDAVIKPYLANKKDKTFMDDWLLDRDLDVYTMPWNYSRLNIVERILLGQRLAGEGPHAERHVQDLFELLPPDIDRWNHLFHTALAGQSLQATDRLGVRAAARAKTAELREQLSRKDRRQLERTAQGMDARTRGAVDEAEAEAGELEAAAELADEEPYRKRSGKEQDRIAGEAAGRYFYDSDVALDAAALGSFFRKLDKTKEWVENNYYRLPIEQQNGKLVTVNAFWRDYAQHNAAQPFYSAEWPGASGNFTEMMFALSVLDLPFKASDHDVEFTDATMTLKAESPLIVVHEQIREVEAKDDATPILVSQDFYRYGERHRQENGEQVDNFVTDEFLVHTLYGSQIVVTNTSSAKQKIDVLLQIPVGAIASLSSRSTRSVHLELEPYHTQTLDYYFYFPAAGDFPHFPVHVAKNEILLAHASARSFPVVEEPSRIDRNSWQYISQFGSPEEVLEFLNTHNVHTLDLSKIAFRMCDKSFFDSVLALLRQRHAYNQTLWSYGIHHNVVPVINQYLQHADQFVRQCGQYFDGTLLTIDPVIRRSYQHMDYRPLVNARAHQLGRQRHILNDRFYAQYHQLMNVLSYRRELDNDDLLSVTYYLLLQDRVAEAFEFFGRVNPDKLETRLQYDYFVAYLDCFRLDPQQAPSIVAKYANYPVVRWRNAFDGIRALLDEVGGRRTEIVDTDNRTQQQTQLAAAEPSFEFEIDAKQVRLTYQNLADAQVNFYLMDLELLFSRNPFVQKFSSQFSLIQPNESLTLTLPAEQNQFEFELPARFHTSNVLVEIVAGGKTRSQAYYANSLDVQLMENYGQLRVTDSDTGQPLPQVYVKAYARMQDGSIRFYKDGYTDLRGRFDFASLNTNEIEVTDRFSLLIMSEDRGAVVREAQPPKR